MAEVTLLYFDGCPSWEITDARLGQLASEYEFHLRRVKVETADDAERWEFHGSPTVLVNGRDVFATGHEQVGLACRVYRTAGGFAGSPTVEQLRRVLMTTVT